MKPDMLSKHSTHELHPQTANDLQSRNGQSVCECPDGKPDAGRSVQSRTGAGPCLWSQLGVPWEGQSEGTQWLRPGRNEAVEVDVSNLGRSSADVASLNSGERE